MILALSVSRVYPAKIEIESPSFSCDHSPEMSKVMLLSLLSETILLVIPILTPAAVCCQKSIK